MATFLETFKNLHDNFHVISWDDYTIYGLNLIINYVRKCGKFPVLIISATTDINSPRIENTEKCLNHYSNNDMGCKPILIVPLECKNLYDNIFPNARKIYYGINLYKGSQNERQRTVGDARINFNK